jgi:MFS family permease
MDPAQWGIVGSAFTLGGLLGALSAGPISSKYGRLRSMQFTTIFFALGPVFETITPNMGVLAFGRFVSGVGAGAALVVVPMYISEIAPPAERGLFGSFTQIMVNVGILIAQLLGYYLSKGQLWRIILAAGGLIGVTQAIGLLLSVDSPKWIAEDGRPTQAKRVLRQLRGSGADIEEEINAWATEGPENVNGKICNLNLSRFVC